MATVTSCVEWAYETGSLIGAETRIDRGTAKTRTARNDCSTHCLTRRISMRPWRAFFASEARELNKC
jgi:hypothetical protein